MVAVEGLTLAVQLEQRLLQAFQKALFPDVGAGIVTPRISRTRSFI